MLCFSYDVVTFLVFILYVCVSYDDHEFTVRCTFVAVLKQSVFNEFFCYALYMIRANGQTTRLKLFTPKHADLSCDKTLTKKNKSKRRRWNSYKRNGFV